VQQTPGQLLPFLWRWHRSRSTNYLRIARSGGHN